MYLCESKKMALFEINRVQKNQLWIKWEKSCKQSSKDNNLMDVTEHKTLISLSQTWLRLVRATNDDTGWKQVTLTDVGVKNRLL